MAPLYKRYIPPKPGASAVQALLSPVPPPAPPPRSVSRAAQQEEPQKRKRERTDEEVAGRKAKKLRKKGIDPATVDVTAKTGNQQPPSAAAEKDVTTQANGVKDATWDRSAVSAQADFTHIKDKKKRHRLEKEARKARIAGERQAKAGADEEEGREQAESEPVVNGVDKEIAPHSRGVAAAVENTALNDEETQTPKKREKRRKGEDVDDEAETAAYMEQKHSKYKQKADVKSHSTTQEQQDDGQQYNAHMSQPKKRRHKLESVLEQSEDNLPTEDNDATDHLKKHGSLLGKFNKSQRLAENTATKGKGDEEQPTAPQPVLRDLVTLPQPEKAPTPEFRPDPNALPPWLAKPTVVADDGKSTFAGLGLDARLTQHLSKLGFVDALPVQQALLPLLLTPGTPGARFLPGAESIVPDIAVGAATGSGKTIAYLLPIVEAMKATAGSGRLNAIVVVPTRELVMQVAAVAESLSKGSKVKIGVATGTGSFSDEQARLTKRERVHDPETYQNLMTKARRLDYPPQHLSQDVGSSPEPEGEENEGFENYLDEIESQDKKEHQLIDDTVSELEGHVPSYFSAVDILVATPGRLLEHLDNTLGFSLAHIKWLVLDEADKLLDGQYSNFLQVVTSELERPHNKEEQDARERYLRAGGRWNEDVERRVRKVVLSATMTTDISKLMDLRFKRPQMLLVRGKGEAEQYADDGQNETSNFELPSTLRELSVHVGDGSEKPLFLLQVLQEHILMPGAMRSPANRKSESDSGNSDVDPSSDSRDSSDLSDSSSDTPSSTDGSSESDADDSKLDDVDAIPDNHDTVHPSRAAVLDHQSAAPTVLIFTSSTESASRLSHLLSTLLPDQASNILTLISTTTAKNLTKSLSTILSTQPFFAITTDRAARGLDALGTRAVTHVVQYDVPRSATNYVHRVGRTARAGRVGEAWTLFTHSEARWFVNEVVRNVGLRRVGGVEKMKIAMEDEAMTERFREAVKGLREGVLSGGRQKRK